MLDKRTNILGLPLVIASKAAGRTGATATTWFFKRQNILSFYPVKKTSLEKIENSRKIGT